MSTNNQQLAVDAIKKKLTGKRLSYHEVFAIMDEIANERLGPVLTTYFAAAGFKEGFNDEELYFLTRAMVDTGPKLRFTGIVADKHSTGGVAGTRTTMILVPIIAAAGFQIPKTSSRAITSPAGTACFPPTGRRAGSPSRNCCRATPASSTGTTAATGTSRTSSTHWIPNVASRSVANGATLPGPASRSCGCAATR